MDIKQEIAKHLEWIEQISSMIGNDTITDEQISELSEHNRCELGKWLSTVESQQLRDFPEFGKLEDNHKTFHVLAGRLIATLRDGDEEQALATGRAFIEISQQVVAHLQALDTHVAMHDDHGDSPAI